MMHREYLEYVHELGADEPTRADEERRRARTSCTDGYCGALDCPRCHPGSWDADDDDCDDGDQCSDCDEGEAIQ